VNDCLTVFSFVYFYPGRFALSIADISLQKEFLLTGTSAPFTLLALLGDEHKYSLPVVLYDFAKSVKR